MKQSITDKFDRMLGLDSKGQGQSVAGLLAGLAIGIFVVVQMLSSLGLSTGLYGVVLGTFLPIILLAAAAGIALGFIRF